jgi:prepilin-type N-terminal cleavage/methylation domain-containing protein
LGLVIPKLLISSELKEVCSMSNRIRSVRRGGFSLIEVIAAVVILAVVATATVATIAPMREKSRNKIDQQSIAKLNGIVQAYFMEYGTYPDRNLTLLRTRGYTSTALQPTPYGGNYQWDNTRLTVVNPRAPAP